MFKVIFTYNLCLDMIKCVCIVYQYPLNCNIGGKLVKTGEVLRSGSSESSKRRSVNAQERTTHKSPEVSDI